MAERSAYDLRDLANFRDINGRKVPEINGCYFRLQFITRRSEVQILPPQL